MLIPRRVKHRKQHHPSRSGMSKGGNKVTFGDFGIQALTPAYAVSYTHLDVYKRQGGCRM